MHIYCLPSEQQTRADTFYRAQRSPMRASKKAQVWVAEEQEIVAALCLQPVESGLWLTSLLVAPEHRCQGLARQLMSVAFSAGAADVWLFCEPSLVVFYQRSGFSPTSQLPPALASRLARYQRSKTLTACYRPADRGLTPASLSR